MNKSLNSTEPILHFDGVCGLCSKGVQFFLKRDKNAKLKFASLQSEIGQQLLCKFDLPLGNFDSLVLIKGNKIWLKSDGVLEASTYLGGVYQASWLLKIIPRCVRDFVYDKIANNRYKWFGKSSVCFLPDPKYKNRFLS